MSGPRHFALILVVCLAAAAFAQTAQRPRSKNKPSPAENSSAAKPTSGASVAATQIAAQPPQVTYVNGLLAINAENSTLADVLAAVRVSTGADVEAPSGLKDRVVVKLGPAPAGEVLADLLNGSGLDYVIVGSPNDSKVLGSVLITRNSTRPATAAVSAPVEASAQAPATGEAPAQTAENETPPEPPAPAPYVDHRSAAEKYLGLPPGVEPTEEDLKKLPTSYPASEGRIIWSSSGPLTKPPANFSRFGMQPNGQTPATSPGAGQASSQNPSQSPSQTQTTPSPPPDESQPEPQ